MAHVSENNQLYHFRAKKNLRDLLLSTLVFGVEEMAQKQEKAGPKLYSSLVMIKTGTQFFQLTTPGSSL